MKIQLPVESSSGGDNADFLIMHRVQFTSTRTIS